MQIIYEEKLPMCGTMNEGQKHDRDRKKLAKHQESVQFCRIADMKSKSLRNSPASILPQAEEAI